MNSRLLAAAVCVAVSFGCTRSGQSSPRPLVLSEGNVAKYVVVVPDETEKPGFSFALSDMTNLLFRATGAAFPIVPRSAAPAKRRLFVGIVPNGEAAPDDGEYAVRVRGSDVYLFGGGAHGTRYAIYEFMENSVGFRFYDIRGGMKVPDGHSRLYVTPREVRRKYDFGVHSLNSWRHFVRPTSTIALYRSGQDYHMKAFLGNAGIAVPPDDYREFRMFCHTIPEYLPRKASDSRIEWIKKLGDSLEKEHPEFFTLYEDGKRMFNHQRCLSNRGARKMLAERVLETIRCNPECTHFDISAGDTPGRYCWCEGCKALESKYGTEAGPIVDFMLEFCPKVEAEFPGVQIMTLVYRKNQTQHPPKGIERMPDNFTPRFAPIDDNFAKDWNHPTNRETYEDLQTWGRLCKHMLLWYYPNPYGGHVTPPLGNVGRLARDIALSKAAGVTGQTHEHNVGVAEMIGFTELQTFVGYHLFKDVSCDWRALADEFIDFEYGAAAEMMRKYWLELERLTETKDLDFVWNAPFAAYRHLTPERLVRWNADFDAMESLVVFDSTRLFNVKRVRINLDYAILCKYAKVKKAVPSFAMSADEVADRIRGTAKRIEKELFPSGRDQGAQFVKGLEGTLFRATVCNKPDAKPLPAELFGKYAADRLYVTLPIVRSAKFEDDADAAFGCRAVMTRPEEKIKLPLKANFHDRAGKHYHWNVGKITEKELGPRGRYKFYKMGEVTLTPDCVLVIGNDSWHDLLADVSAAYEEGSFNKAELWASIKFEGPAFYPEDAGKPNRVLCDRVVVVRK
ncbi:MAG: DUF4838 domain-containing protein [Kiritimatiellae bacterium]|nr:DUF4838 domain-containing protein [Kiritimatiellia bacterium]